MEVEQGKEVGGSLVVECFLCEENTACDGVLEDRGDLVSGTGVCVSRVPVILKFTEDFG